MTTDPHSASATNASSATAAPESPDYEWLHCNRCFCDLWSAHRSSTGVVGAGHGHMHPLAAFHVTQCGHVLCSPCYGQTTTSHHPTTAMRLADPAPIITCPVCGTPNVGSMQLCTPDGVISADLAPYFSPLVPQFEHLKSAVEFRQTNVNAFIRFLKGRLEQQRTAIERATRELQDYRDLKTEHAVLQEKFRALQTQHESLVSQHHQHGMINNSHPSRQSSSHPFLSTAGGVAGSGFQSDYRAASMSMSMSSSATTAAPSLPPPSRRFQFNPRGAATGEGTTATAPLGSGISSNTSNGHLFPPQSRSHRQYSFRPPFRHP
ncbi:hypothetical protein BC828DRAFT_262349 [Blastocladiella britannica]|nr:hypothetical protein BC828DRAFT_262349 [Blastocladiella britannica]